MMIKRAKDLYQTYAKKAGQQVEDLSSRTIPTDTLKVDAIGGMTPEQYLEYIRKIANPVGVLSHKQELGNEDLHSLHELIIYGLKGTAAYAHHAEVLGQESDEIYRVGSFREFSLIVIGIPQLA
jgi:hydroxylamine reductase